MDDARAYRQTTFEADTPVGRAEIRVGGRDDHLDRLLEYCSSSSWAFLTAWNPEGTFTNETENRRRQEALESELSDRGYRVFPGKAVPDPPNWAPEQAVLAVGIDRDEALAVAREFDQDVVLRGERDGRAELLDCESGEPVSDDADDSAPPGPSDVEEELGDMLEDLGGTVGESVDRYRAKGPERAENAVDWEVVLRSLDDEYPDPDLD